ncbi:hypothetical protein [Streptomyces sp. ICBB 8177]|uniref:hypothetical protein n=1 Tax=Streptomyces sp. ICBB 8177 TaxID=563922 RepID=UPI000D67E24E|nr:hypothetical protein [Streptomyces sp. ICBB 8177]PWI44106.1 hypothetical protein CK485_18945 [Streptomyces sp. ICBB 8177]
MSTPQPDVPAGQPTPTATTDAPAAADDSAARPDGHPVPYNYNPYPPHQPYFAVPEPPRKPRNPWVFVVAGLLLSVVGFPIYKIAGDYHHVYTRPPQYTLSTPKTLLGGDFRLVTTDGGRADAALDGHRDDPLHYADLHATNAYYARVAPAGSQQETLVVDGFHGKVYVPDLDRRQFAQAVGADGTTFAVAPRDVTPSSGGSPLTCGVAVARKGPNAGRPAPLCVWADDGTIALVYDNLAKPRAAGSVDLAAYATEVAAVRDQMAVRLS